ncbi:MAG TPA: pantoate--beta-alanine ligase [Bacteroidales bacterium]|nr:pantoate--beta-alanine ligase [Bacteroidales bacterium]
MQVFGKTKGVVDALNKLKKEGKSIGFVPTMGALHAGHITLIERAVSENDIVVASIFVNPTQFNDQNDLRNYPRNLEKDLRNLEAAACDIVFFPEVIDMYPEPDNRVFNFGRLEEVMEGAHRPGHFNGVAQVVSKFFDIIKPHRAYFGEKDFQQLTIIREMDRQLSFQIEIVPCPIVREPDGLAMSSRNQLLSPEQRASAPLIAKTLFYAQKHIKDWSVEQMKEEVIGTINQDENLEVEYFEIADENTLLPIENWHDSDRPRAFIAVKDGGVRLIDNVIFY